MSQIYDLIAEHCPTGVQFKELGQVGVFIRGNGLQKGDLTKEGVGAIHYGQIHTHYGTWADATKSFVSDTVAKKLRKASPGDLVIATTSEDDEAVAKAVAWLGQEAVAVSGDAYIFRHDLDPKYASYFFQSENFRLQKKPRLTGTKVRRISGEALSKIRLPVPPLRVQQEIATILDRYSDHHAELESKLEAELEARRKQYHHYRNALLRFDEQTGQVIHMALGEVAEIRSGWGFPNHYQGQSDGEYPFYKVSDMNRVGNEVVMTSANNFIDQETVKKLGVKPAPAGTVIFPKIGAAVATNKKRLLSIPSAYDNNVMGLIPGSQLHPRFLFFWMQTVDLTTVSHDSGAVPSIRKSEMEQLKVPVPPLEEQARIVGILDKFDALVNDLTSGLPEEISARRQQYQHYRDRLLTFKKAA